MSASVITALQPYGTIPEADQQLFLAAWECRIVAEGEFLSQAGAICQELFFIREGVLRLVARPQRGKEVTHAFRQQGQLCTILTSFEQQVPSRLAIQAACPAQVLAISKASLEVLSRQLLYLSDLLAHYLQEELRAKLHLHRAYLGQNAAMRYHTFLEREPEVARRVPQHMIASYLGITPQSLSRLRHTSY